jgi:hypothetical protein
MKNIRFKANFSFSRRGIPKIMLISSGIPKYRNDYKPEKVDSGEPFCRQ